MQLLKLLLSLFLVSHVSAMNQDSKISQEQKKEQPKQKSAEDKKLLKAARRGKLKEVEEALANGANINTQDSDTCTPLYWALYNKHIEVVKVLLAAGASYEVKKDVSALEVAICVNSDVLVGLLLDHESGKILETKTKALHFAIAEGRHSIVELLVKRGAKVNDGPEINVGNIALDFTPIMIAVVKKRAVDCERLIDAKANVNVDIQIGGIGMPLLAFAFIIQDEHIIHALLKGNPDVNRQSSDGKNALDYAILKKTKASIVEEILKLKADISKTDENQCTPLHRAAVNSAAYQDGNLVVELLIKYGANVNAEAVGGITPLILAIDNGTPTAVDLLIKAGAKTNIKDSQGNTPMHLAAQKGNANMIDSLVKAGAALSDKDNRKQTALHKALASGHTQVIEHLLAKGHEHISSEESYDSKYVAKIQKALDLGKSHDKLVLEAVIGNTEHVTSLISSGKIAPEDINKQDKAGMTALMYATVRGDEELVKALLKVAYTPQESVINSLLKTLKIQDKPINILLTNKNGETALMLAHKHKRPKIAEILYESLKPLRDQIIAKIAESGLKFPVVISVIITDYLYGAKNIEGA